MKRHNVTRVVLLGVGGVQKDDAEWIAAAARKYPDRVIAGLPVPDPTSDGAAQRLADDLARRRPRVRGEVHLRQLGRRNIERDPNDAAFGKVLDLAAQYGVPVVVHYELTDSAAAALSRALAAHRKATLVLAHAGEGPPPHVEGPPARHPNPMADLSGMHRLRQPPFPAQDGP